MSAATAEVLIFDAKLMEEKEYWCKRLAVEAGSSNFPLDFERTTRPFRTRESVAVAIKGDLYQRLASLTGGSPFLTYTALLTAVKVCLHRYTRSTRLVVGSPVLRGEGARHQRPNVLSIVDELDPQMSFRELLLKVRETLLAAYERQRYPFTRLVKDLGLSQTETRCAIFDVIVTHRDIHEIVPELGNDVTISFAGATDGLIGEIEFNPDLMMREGIERYRGHLLNVLDEALADTSKAIHQFGVLTESESRQIVVEWNKTGRDYSSTRCIHELFEAQVEQRPNAVAVISGKECLSYADLNARANQLAHYLRSRGVAPEVTVGVYAERSVEMIVALIAVLKAGGVYLPLDPIYPGELLAFMLADAGAGVLLTQDALAGRLPDYSGQIFRLDADWGSVVDHDSKNPPSITTPLNLAYMIYTSGSTGRPKGVLVQHQGVCNLAEAQIRAFGVGTDSRVLQFASFGFDASVSEVFMVLVSGASLCLEPRELLMSGPDLIELIQTQGITTVTFPPSFLAALPSTELSGLTTIIVAGEPCSADLVTRWGRGRRFLNAYGPTEGTVCATIAECEETGRKPSIGHPMANVQVYILDTQLRPVPIGTPGELYIGGAGLARGYNNQAALTAARFIPSPFSEMAGQRLYRTGDLVRHLADGCIEFLGRIDFQVKIRGFRIELGEIEAALELHSAVRAAVVTVRQDPASGDSLVAYLVPNSETAIATSDLRQFLRAKLPEHMMPVAFVILDSLPLTASGKINRQALPAPEQFQSADSFAGPRTPIEEMLAGIWAEIFKRQQVSIHANFFELGGHSLLATQVMSRVRKAFHVTLPLRSLFEAPTVAGLAERIVEAQVEQAGAAETDRALQELEELSDDEVRSLLADAMQLD